MDRLAVSPPWCVRPKGSHLSHVLHASCQIIFHVIRMLANGSTQAIVWLSPLHLWPRSYMHCYPDPDINNSWLNVPNSISMCACLVFSFLPSPSPRTTIFLLKPCRHLWSTLRTIFWPATTLVPWWLGFLLALYSVESSLYKPTHTISASATIDRFLRYW